MTRFFCHYIIQQYDKEIQKSSMLLSASLTDLLFSTSLKVREQYQFSYDPCEADSAFVVEPSSSSEDTIIS